MPSQRFLEEADRRVREGTEIMEAKELGRMREREQVCKRLCCSLQMQLGPQAKEDRQPQETGKGKETGYLPEASNTLSLVQF